LPQGLSHSDDLPLIGALLESFTSGGSQPADRKPSEVGLRGPRPDPLTVASHSIAPTIDRSQSDMSDPAASPYDVTTPSSGASCPTTPRLPPSKSIH
jgi:hypothetical protein